MPTEYKIYVREHDEAAYELGVPAHFPSPPKVGQVLVGADHPRDTRTYVVDDVRTSAFDGIVDVKVTLVRPPRFAV